MEKIKVLIADDIMILRQGLKAVLEQDKGIEVVALAENGKEAYEKSRVFMPDVVLMDMRMPDYDGAYGIHAIKERLKDVRVLVLTTFDDEETIEKALASGADGYILKEMEDEKVIASVKSVYAGMNIFGDGAYRVLRNRIEQTSGRKEIKNQESVVLTGRERDVLRLLAQGNDNREIAEILFLAEGTVKDRTQLAVYAVKNGLDV